MDYGEIVFTKLENFLFVPNLARVIIVLYEYQVDFIK